MPAREITTAQWALVDPTAGAVSARTRRRVTLVIALLALMGLVYPAARSVGYAGDGEGHPLGLAGFDSVRVGYDLHAHTITFDTEIANNGWFAADVVGAESRERLVDTVRTTHVSIPAGGSRRVTMVFRVTDCRHAPRGDIWPNLLIDRLWGTQRSMIDIALTLPSGPARIACGYRDT